MGKGPIMRGVRPIGPLRLLFGLTIGYVGASVGCGPWGASQGPLEPQKVEQHKQITRDYMKGTKVQQGKAGLQGRHPGGPPISRP